MKATKHQDGDVSIRLTNEEAQRLWCLIREGRRAIVAQEGDTAFTMTRFALDLMREAYLDRGASNQIIHEHVQKYPVRPLTD